MSDRASGKPHQEERWASEMDAVDGYLRFKKQQKAMGRDVRRRSGGSTTISGQSSRSTSANGVGMGPLPQQPRPFQPPQTTPSAPPLWQLPPSHISTRTTTATSVLTWSTDDSRSGRGGGYEPRPKAGGVGVQRPSEDGGGYSGSSSALLREFSMSDSGGPLLVSDRRDVVVDEGLFQELRHGGNHHIPTTGGGGSGGDAEDLDSFLTELSQYERLAKRKEGPRVGRCDIPLPHQSPYQVRASPTPSPLPHRAAIRPDSLSPATVSASRSRGQSTVWAGGISHSRGRDASLREGTPMLDTAPPPPPNPPPPPRHAPVYEEQQRHHQRHLSSPTTPTVVSLAHHDQEPPTTTIPAESERRPPSPATIEVPTAASVEAVHDACGRMLHVLNEVHLAVPRLRSVISGSVGDVSLLISKGHCDGGDTPKLAADGGGEGGLSMGKEVWGFYTNVLNRRYADPVTAAHHTRIRKHRLVQIRRELRDVKGKVEALATRRRELLQNN